MSNREKYEQLILASPLFSLDKENERNAYQREARKMVGYLYSYLMEINEIAILITDLKSQKRQIVVLKILMQLQVTFCIISMRLWQRNTDVQVQNEICKKFEADCMYLRKMTEILEKC